MTQFTSAKAFSIIRKQGLLSEKRFNVLKVLFYLGEATGGEIAAEYKKRYRSAKHSEAIRNRLSELRDFGVVKEVGTRFCSETGYSAIVWTMTGNLPVKPDKKKTLKKQIEQTEKRLAKLKAQYEQC